MNIIRADKSHLSEVARLFDLYRQFYECPPDIELATNYISERMANNESVIFAAEGEDGKLLGFTQLYPTFCSVQAVKIFVLYDIYVDAAARKKDVGTALMQQAADYCKSQGAKRMDLLTGKDNYAGQGLYEKMGWYKTNEAFYAHSLDL